MNENFRSLFCLGQWVSLDEGMIPFKGRSFLKQYLPMKPIKWGFKLFALCCAATGYFYNIMVYEGEGTVEDDTGHGMTYHVVMQLLDMADIDNSNRILVCDRYYTGLQLFFDLVSKRGIECVGTAMRNRLHAAAGFLDKITKKSERGASAMATWSKHGVTMHAVSWKDTKVVLFLSTILGGATTTVPRVLRGGGGRKVDVPCFEIAKAYTAHMGGVDIGDQMRLRYGVEKAMRFNKPWFKMFAGLLDIAVTNATIIYKHYHPESERKTMLKHLLQELLGQAGVMRGSRSSVVVARHKCTGHLLSASVVPDENKQPAKLGNAVQCVVCMLNGVRKRTRAYCSNCRFFFCRTGDCFAWHTRNTFTAPARARMQPIVG